MTSGYNPRLPSSSMTFAWHSMIMHPFELLCKLFFSREQSPTLGKSYLSLILALAWKGSPVSLPMHLQPPFRWTQYYVVSEPCSPCLWLFSNAQDTSACSPMRFLALPPSLSSFLPPSSLLPSLPSFLPLFTYHIFTFTRNNCFNGLLSTMVSKQTYRFLSQ